MVAQVEDGKLGPGRMLYTDGSKLQCGSTGAAVVAINEAGDVILAERYKLASVCTVLQAEIFAIAKACDWICDRPNIGVSVLSDYTIVTDSLAATQAPQKEHPPKWPEFWST